MARSRDRLASDRLAGMIVLLSVAAGSPAMAGPCSTEISDLHKAMSAKDAGSGPVVVPGGAEQNQAGIGEGMNAARMDPASHGDATSNAPSRTPATSAAEVRKQQEQPPAGAQGAGGAPAEDPLTKVNEAMKRAEHLDSENSQDCHAAVQEARNLLGERSKQ